MAGSSDWAALRAVARVTALLALPWLAACDGKEEQPGRGATAAAGDRCPAAGQEGHRVGRVHRPLRAGRECRHPRPRLGLSPGSAFQGRPVVDKDELLFVIDPRPFQLAVERAKAASRSRRRGCSWRRSSWTAPPKLVNTSALSQSTYDQRLQEKRSRGGGHGLGRGGGQAGGARSFLTPTSPRRSPAACPTGGWMWAIVSGGGADAADDHRVRSTRSTSIFDMSEGDYLAYQRLATARHAAVTRATPPTRFHAHLADERDWPHEGKHEFPR